MSVLIGLDVGWSERRRSCGLAVLGARLEEPGTVMHGDISTVALNKRDVARVLYPIVHRSFTSGQRVLIVTDAIVGPHRVPPTDRRVDKGCSTGGFYGRCQSYPATQNAGRLLSTTLHDILANLFERLRPIGATWTPWLGDSPLPSMGVVVTETNPTTSMALALSMADRESLPTRKSPRKLLDGTRVRAKSDWYWRSGASEFASRILGAPSIRKEVHHERVAGLWCLALAHELDTAGKVALLGDDCGTYLVGSIDPSWAVDIERVGVKWGPVQQVARTLMSPYSIAEQVVDLSTSVVNVSAPSSLVTVEDEDALRGDIVSVLFTDTGGLTKKANPWLDSVEFPCTLRLQGPTTIEVKVSPFANRNDRSQFKVGPTTIGELMRMWDGPSTLSKGTVYEVRATLL